MSISQPKVAPQAIATGDKNHVPNWPLWEVAGGNPSKSCLMKQLGGKEDDFEYECQSFLQSDSPRSDTAIQKSKSW